MRCVVLSRVVGLSGAVQPFLNSLSMSILFCWRHLILLYPFSSFPKKRAIGSFTCSLGHQVKRRTSESRDVPFRSSCGSR